MASKAEACGCTASTHAVAGVKARGSDVRVCGVEIEPKHAICPPCAKGNHERIVCDEYVPKPTAAHLDRRCDRCGFDSAAHPIPKGGLSSRPGPMRAYGRVNPFVELAVQAMAERRPTLRGWLGRMIPRA